MSETNHRLLGQVYEACALRFLQMRGFKLVDKNFRCPYGEIDLIVRLKELIVFVEVRYRQRDDWGNAQESITQQKQDKIIKTANVFLQHHNLNKVDCRFDAVVFNGRSTASLEWIPNAFELTP